MDITHNTITGNLSKIAHDVSSIQSLPNQFQGKEKTESISVFAEKSNTDQITISAEAGRLNAKEKTDQEKSSTDETTLNKTNQESL